MFRAVDRLRGGEDSQVAVREVSGRGYDSGNADEVGRRSDGHRPNVQGSPAEGNSLAGTAHAMACACGYAGIAAARKIGDTAPRPHPLAAHRCRAWAAELGNLRANENRSV